MNQILNGIVPNALWDIIKYIVVPKQEKKDAKITINNDVNIVLKIDSDKSIYQEQLIKLKVLVELINASLLDKITPSKIAEILNEESLLPTIDIFNGTSLPDFKYLHKLKETFGFNIDYFHGVSRSVFDVSFDSKHNPLEYYETLENIDLEQIYFLMSYDGDVSIVVNTENYKYKMIASNLYIKDDVGDTGLWKMKQLQKLIKKMNDNKMIFRSLILNNNDYDALIDGSLYAGVLKHPNIETSYWADDYIDIEYYQKNKRQYKESYGAKFINSMELLI